MSVAPSRLLFGLIPWYSFLIVLGASAAIILAVREEKRTDFRKDTVIDFSLIVLPCGIIGARVYYVVFSWPQFRNDLISVFKIWEGGIAIYGGIIAGLITAWVFCRVRKISFLTLCDLIAPGLILAQAVGRWGNYFNQECYGLAIGNPGLQFFPFGVQILTDSGFEWHMATFFYEFLWNSAVFIFLLFARRKWFRYHGDVFFFYAFLYACGRFIIEDFRTDSLYATSSIRVSQLLSVLICILVLLRYCKLFMKKPGFRSIYAQILLFSSFAADFAAVLWMTGLLQYTPAVPVRFALLLLCSFLNIFALFLVYRKNAEGECIYADHKS